MTQDTEATRVIPGWIVCPDCDGAAEHVYNDRNGDPQWDYAVPCRTCTGDDERRASTNREPAPEPGDVYPCVKITVDDAGKVVAGSLYAPGLPAGTFNIYPVGIENCATGRPANVSGKDSGAEALRQDDQKGAAPEFGKPRLKRAWNTPRQDSQHVLKAEGASPDATDRENPANASPVGGPMGAGQPAAAGPIGAPVAAALREAAQAVLLGATPFDNDFRRTAVDTWRIKALGEALRALAGETP